MRRTDIGVGASIREKKALAIPLPDDTTTMKNFVRFALAFGLLFCAFLGHASSGTVADSNVHYRASLLVDHTGERGIDEIRKQFADQFQPMDGLASNFGYSRAAYWVRLELENTDSQDQAIIIRQDYPLIDYVDLWVQTPQGWQQHGTGDRRPFAERQIDHREFLFPLTLNAGEGTTVYLRFASDGAVNISLSLATPSSMLEHIGLEQLLYGGYFGGFLVLIIYNLIIFLVVRDKAYFYYMMYVLSLGTYMAVSNGLAFQYFWPNNPWFANQSLLFFLGLSVIFGLHFSRTMCSIREYAPRFDLFTRALLGVSIVLLLASPFLSYKLLILPFSFNTLLVAVAMLVLGFISMFRGSKAARYFVVAWAAFLLGVIVYLLKSFGVLEHNVITHNAQQIGSLIEMVLLSLALSARVNEIKEAGHSDPLTSLANRRVLDGVFPVEFSNAQKHLTPLSLLVLDIDHFKRFNDRLGHAIGDEVIERVGRILREHVRKPHLPCRYGGEEFVVVLPNCDAAEAEQLAERLRQQLENRSTYTLPITVSIGVATFTGTEFSHHQAMFEAADAALYQAKQAGRNCVRRAA